MIITGKSCPRRGGKLETFETRVRDRHAPDGWSYASYNLTVRMDHQISEDDRKVKRVIETGAHKGETVTEYVHVCAAWCKPCGIAFTERELKAL